MSQEESGALRVVEKNLEIHVVVNLFKKLNDLMGE
jgi:hypothetical protein